MKTTLAARRAALILLLACIPAALAQTPPPFSADYSVASANGNLNMAGKTYFALPKMRMDVTNTGQGRQAGPFGGKMSMIIDAPAKVMYMIMPEQQMYMEMSLDREGPMSRSMPKFEEMFRGSDPCSGREGATCKKIGAETVNGRSCDKWEVAEKGGKTETLWVDQKLHFPIKVIRGDITTQYTNIKEGPQDPALFKVPDGYRKFDAGALGQRPR